VSFGRTRRNSGIGLGLLVLLVLLALTALGGGMLGHGLVGGYGARPLMVALWLWGIGLFGLFVRLVVWGALIVLVVSLFRRLAAHSDDLRGAALSSLEILKRRYAAGEITRQQFEDMRRVLDPTT
jgi:uncharacterized membrane protein